MDRKHKPPVIPISPFLPQPSVDVSDLTVTAKLPSHDGVTINLFGATVTSWTTIDSSSSSPGIPTEKLFLSTAAKLDGSKAIRGGIPIVFPVFGPPPKDHATGKLPQHGFARSALWEFLGKNTSESASGNKGGDEEVKLDFGLSSAMLGDEMRQLWPYDFGLVYSVTLGKGYLDTSLHVRNIGQGQTLEFQALFHNYFRVDDVTKTSVYGLHGKPFINKITSEQQAEHSDSKDDAAKAITISSATDTVYKSLIPSEAVTIVQESLQAPKPQLKLTRQTLPDCTLWNPWQQGAESMADFAPKEAYRNMICVEPGAVDGWIRIEPGDTWEGRQTIRPERI